MSTFVERSTTLVALEVARPAVPAIPLVPVRVDVSKALVVLAPAPHPAAPTVFNNSPATVGIPHEGFSAAQVPTAAPILATVPLPGGAPPWANALGQDHTNASQRARRMVIEAPRGETSVAPYIPPPHPQELLAGQGPRDLPPVAGGGWHGIEPPTLISFPEPGVAHEVARPHDRSAAPDQVEPRAPLPQAAKSPLPNFDLQPGVEALRDFGRLGATTGGWVLSKLLDHAEAVDTQLYGKRGWLIVGSAFLGVIAHLFDATEWLGAISSILLFYLVAIVVLARIAIFRSEEGQSTASQLLTDRVRAAGEEAREVFEGFQQAAPNDQCTMAGGFLMVVSVILLDLWNLITHVFQLVDDAYEFFSIGLVVGIAGASLWAFGRYRLHRIARPQRASSELSCADPRAFIQRLDPVISADDPMALSAVANHGDGGLIPEVLQALMSWQPRRCQYEEGYQRSLVRHFRSRIPWALAEEQLPLPRAGRSTLRIDIALQDGSDTAVGIEMKRRLNLREARAAVGQVQDYAECWSKRGPVILVLCDPEPQHTPTICERVRALHEQGHPVFVALVPIRRTRRDGLRDFA